MSGRKSYNGISDIPSGSRKMVQSLKEIVNCPEAEIYAVLKDCNMDPNETVNRLLSQDPFHEVKSKKDKKKEIKDIPDSRSRGYSNSYNRGNRSGGGSDRYGGRSGAAAPFNSNESRSFQGKATNKRDSEKQTSGSSTYGASSQQQIPNSDHVAVESKTPAVSSGSGISSVAAAAAQPVAWFGSAGQMSMADIVKRGLPQNQTTNSRNNVDKRPEVVNHEREVAVNHHVPEKVVWPSIEKTVPVAPTESEIRNGPADPKGQLEDTHLDRDHVLQPDIVTSGDVHEDDDSGVSSECDDDDQYIHQTQNHTVEQPQDEDGVSSVTANLQELAIENQDQYSSQEEDRPAVVIPDHLLIHTKECSQLSFGSFGGFGSRPLNNNLEEASGVHVDARHTEFYGDDEHLESIPNGNMVHGTTAEQHYDDSPNQENPQDAHQENQYSFNEPEYAYENAKQQQQQQQQIQQQLNIMQGYTSSIPNPLLAQSAQSLREFELQYLQQSMPSRSNDSSLSGQPEALRGVGGGGGNQTTQPNANIATGPALPQQLPPIHQYSQPSVPLPHYTNMMGYPMMPPPPQSYQYMPSAFPQAYAGNTSYNHQSLPQYKTNTLPQSETSPPTSSSTYGNFPQAGPTGATLSYEDLVYKQNSHLLSLHQQQQQQQQHQNENSPMWLQGPGSSAQSNAYYNLQALHAQQMRQAQQQQYGSLGYPNYYQSQGGMSMEQQHQQQNPRDGGGSQGQQVPSKQTQQQQLWQNSY